MAAQRTCHQLPNTGWLNTTFPFLKKTYKASSFHTRFLSSLLTSLPSSPTSSAIHHCWSHAVEEQQQSWGWPIHSQCGGKHYILSTWKSSHQPSLFFFFPCRNKPTSLLLVQCSHNTFLFVSSLFFLHCSFPLLFSIPKSGWVKGLKYNRVTCPCSDWSVRGSTCCMASQGVERSRRVAGGWLNTWCPSVYGDSGTHL